MISRNEIDKDEGKRNYWKIKSKQVKQRIVNGWRNG